VQKVDRGQPVEEREVSPLQVRKLWHDFFGPDGTLDLLLMVNGEQIGRHTITHSITEPPLEIPLPEVEPRSLQ
jgi:hypothetical protein